MIPSKFQEIIYTDAEYTKNNMIINALAGSGKTTTIIEVSKFLKGSIIFLAFNKSIAEEIKGKISSTVKCSTLHSVGYALLKSHFGNVQVNENKIYDLMNEYVPLQYDKKGREIQETTKLRKAVRELVSKIKNTSADYKDYENIEDLIDIYNIDIEVDEVFEHVGVIMHQSNSDMNSIDFDDMIYLPEYLNLQAKFKYDNVIVDEAQDLNTPQINLVLKILKKSGRFFAVGDPRQAIFYFRGSDKNSMNRLQRATNAVKYDLPICYRCPPAHLDLIRDIVPEIKAFKENAGNDVITTYESQFIEDIVKEINPMVICRTNAYMIKFVLKLLKMGHKAKVLGKNFGDGLVKIVNKLKCEDIGEFSSELYTWKIKEFDKLNCRENKAPQVLYDNIEDKYSVLENIACDCESMEDLLHKLDVLFTDKEEGNCITFSTVHKIKGCEYDTVYILAPFLLPMKRKGQTPEEFEAELNVKYVAYTRSKRKLVIVEQD